MSSICCNLSSASQLNVGCFMAGPPILDPAVPCGHFAAGWPLSLPLPLPLQLLCS